MRGVICAGIIAFIPLTDLRGESLTLCDEKVDYHAALVPSGTTGSDLVGVWVGDLIGLNVPYSIHYKRCLAFAVESVSLTGQVLAKHVAGSAIKNMNFGTTFHSKPTVMSWTGQLSGNGTLLRFARNDGTVAYEFDVRASNSLEGRFSAATGDGRVWLKKK